MVTDDELVVLGSHAVAYAARYPQPGWAEQDVDDWVRALQPAIAGALADAGLQPADVRALGVAGQLDGCVPLDSWAGAFAPCLIWMDRRADSELPALPDDFRARTGLTADGGHMAAKIRWLQRHYPGRARWFHQPVSYLVYRLTNEHVFDPGLASTTMLYDLRGHYDSDLAAAFGVDVSALPRVAPAYAQAGPLSNNGAALSGLMPGIPVAVGTGDDFATPLGAGIAEPGPVACVLGTAEVVGALADAPVIDDDGLVETHAYPTGAYFVENPGWLAGGALTWLCETLGFASAAELDAAAAQVPAGADGLVFIPALSGAMAPRWIASARGCFYGLTPAHGRGHLARAVLEGCAFAMRDVIDRLRALNVRTERVVLLGGGAASEVWARIRADVACLPVHRSTVTDSCAVGAAMCAAVAGQVQPDLQHCAARVPAAELAAEPSGARYDDAHARYRALFDALEPVMRST